MCRSRVSNGHNRGRLVAAEFGPHRSIDHLGEVAGRRGILGQAEEHVVDPALGALLAPERQSQNPRWRRSRIERHALLVPRREDDPS